MPQEQTNEQREAQLFAAIHKAIGAQRARWERAEARLDAVVQQVDDMQKALTSSTRTARRWGR